MSEQKVEAVERALSIMDAFSDGSPRLSLTDLTKRTGLYRSTLLRLASSLQRFGYLRRGEDGYFRLGSTLLRLGVLYQNAFNLADYIRPVLDRIVETTGETAAFYVRDGDNRLCLYRKHSPRLIRHHLDEGTILPLEIGASARILVAFTDGSGEPTNGIRESGFYTSLGERDPESSAIAVPIFSSGHVFVGALGVTGSTSRFTPEARSKMLTILMESAATLSRSLGGRFPYLPVEG